ncbi:sensor histidine kinase [Actinoplanes sp. DH11]|uniref:sensor histidine kinase n=1 Tax=Actinoplanes sp. DH11 TaxID=2857011 RepID=UPI001E65007C|nr:sensor histidine kinase [Actinoplanes sp. DH11]
MREHLRSLRSVRGALTATAVVAGIALVVAGQVTGAGRPAADEALLTAPIALSFTLMGALVLVGVGGHVVGRLMILAGLAACVALLGASWSTALPAAWLSQWSWWPPFPLIFLALLYFPDGRLPSPRWRPLAAVIALAGGLATAGFATAALHAPRTLLTEIDTPVPEAAGLPLRIAGLSFLTATAGLLGVLWSLAARWRRADDETRHQLMCLLPAGVLMVIGFGLSTAGVSGAWAVAAMTVPIAMTVAVLRYHLYNLDTIVSRALVWSIMSLLVVAGYVLIVATVRQMFVARTDAHASLAATGVIAVAFEPLRRRVQIVVNRLLYGDRDTPYKVVAQLGDLLGRTIEPRAVLPLLTSTVARSLQVPYVAVELAEDGYSRRHAEHGTPSTAVESFDMVAHGQQVGRLLVATRSPGGRFSRRECRLLQGVAVHAAVAAEATKLVRDLQHSRLRLVRAREEERRKLRRDLHDGLGPSLAGMSMQVRAAQKLVPDQSRVRQILTSLAGDLKSCTAEVRELVDQLRPPALDNGLESALRAECRRFDGADLSVRLHLSGDLETLPAAVEVVVYRTVAEALTNVVRHAEACVCDVAVERSAAALTVRITDDGVGMDRPTRPGVGLASLRERAAELGGRCTITASPPGGTAVTATLPLVPMAVPVAP